MMKIDEFIEMYSDDLIQLVAGREARLTHPLRLAVKELCDASYCRFLAVHMVSSSSIEHLLETWKESDPHGVLAVYFSDRAKNGERVANLFEAFKSAGIKLERDVFDDYLAIKYLRNVVVHAREKNYETEWLDRRGFPVDPRRLTSEHWRRMLWVSENMMWYLLQVFLPKSERKVKPLPPDQPEGDLPPVLSRDDIAQVFWNNLERISQRLFGAFEAASASGAVPGSWTSKEEGWIALWRESGRNPALFAAQRELVDRALFSWSEYSRLTFEEPTLALADLERVVWVLRQLHERRAGTAAPLFLPRNTPASVARELLRAQVPDLESLDEKLVLEALTLGERLYEIMVNITPCYLFAVQLPIVAPEAVVDFAAPATYAILAMEAGQLWKGLFDLGPDLSNLMLLRSLIQTWTRPDNQEPV